MIRQSLQKTQWHRGKAADMLNIPRRTLQRKMVKYGFRAPDGV
jgi:DNA-binding NtrC family response regulator